MLLHFGPSRAKSGTCQSFDPVGDIVTTHGPDVFEVIDEAKSRYGLRPVPGLGTSSPSPRTASSVRTSPTIFRDAGAHAEAPTDGRAPGTPQN